MRARRKKRRDVSICAPVLTSEDRALNAMAEASLERAAQLRIVKGTDVRYKPARPEDRLWELSRIADALEERLRILEERTRL